MLRHRQASEMKFNTSATKLENGLTEAFEISVVHALSNVIHKHYVVVIHAINQTSNCKSRKSLHTVRTVAQNQNRKNMLRVSRTQTARQQMARFTKTKEETVKKSTKILNNALRRLHRVRQLPEDPRL